MGLHPTPQPLRWTPHPRSLNLGEGVYWQIFRLYLMPLCVSSFAALIKGRGFVLVLHPDLEGNLLAFGLVAALCAVVWLAKRSTVANAGANAVAPHSVPGCTSPGAGLESSRGI